MRFRLALAIGEDAQDAQDVQGTPEALNAGNDDHRRGPARGPEDTE